MIKGGVNVSGSLPAFMSYGLSRHAVQRFGTARNLDPITAILRAHEDLAVSRVVTVEEARKFLHSGLRFREGRTYLAGSTGLYVCVGNRVLTYIDRDAPRFRNRWDAWGPYLRRKGRRRR